MQNLQIFIWFILSFDLQKSKTVVSLNQQIKQDMATSNNTLHVAITKMNGSDRVLVHFFNSTRVYDRKGFDTMRKAQNYIKKYGYALHDRIPCGLIPLI